MKIKAIVAAILVSTASVALANGTAAPAAPAINVVRMFQLMNQSFQLEELRDLAFMIDIDHENLPTAKRSFARELIREAQNTQRLAQLLDLCRHERPQMDW